MMKIKIASITVTILCIALSACLFAEAQDYSWNRLPVIAAPVFKKDTFNIVAYGAKGDGLTFNTNYINKAINDCSQAGGGVVLVPEGVWLTGPIVLRSNVNLHIDRAATLQFSDDKDLYPLVLGNWEGRPAVRCKSPISGDGLENIAITGKGIIDGNGDVWRAASREKYTETEWKKKIDPDLMGVLSDDGKTWYPSQGSFKGSKTKNAGVWETGKTLDDYKDIKDYLRPNLVVLTRCKKVLLEGAGFQNSPAWCLHPLMCEDLTLRDVHVRNPWNAQNGDGVDVESCKNVLIENSSFDAGDDGICIKSGRDADGRKRGMPTENVIIRGDIVYRAHGGFVIGSEMSGGARNIFVSDCSFMGTDIGLRFKTTRGRGGLVEKIYVKNIRMKDIIHEAIFLDMYYMAKARTLAGTKGQESNEPVPPVTEATPRFRDIHISNVVCDGAEEGIFIRGLPEMSIQDIYLDHIILKVDKGAEVIAAKNISLSDIRFMTDLKNTLIYVENSSALRLDSVRYYMDPILGFSINGDKCGDIRVTNTDLGNMKVRTEFNYGATKDMLQIQRN
jgi:polygalacturonase